MTGQVTSDSWSGRAAPSNGRQKGRTGTPRTTLRSTVPSLAGATLPLVVTLQPPSRVVLRSRLAVLLLPLVGVLGCERRGPNFVESMSPRGTYKVVVSGISEAPTGRPFVEHKARLSVSKGSHTFLSDREIHFADWFDSGFNDDFSGHEWMQENVFRFVSSGARWPHFLDRLVIRNHADKGVRFLRLESRDMLLFFDLGRGAEIAVQLTGQLRVERVRDTNQTSYSWVAADGVWEDGEAIEFLGTNFWELPMDTAQEYTITVTNAGLAIELVKK